MCNHGYRNRRRFHLVGYNGYYWIGWWLGHLILGHTNVGNAFGTSILLQTMQANLVPLGEVYALLATITLSVVFAESDAPANLALTLLDLMLTDLRATTFLAARFLSIVLADRGATTVSATGFLSIVRTNLGTTA